jgi:hypothetical protein
MTLQNKQPCRQARKSETKYKERRTLSKGSFQDMTNHYILNVMPNSPNTEVLDKLRQLS